MSTHPVAAGGGNGGINCKRSAPLWPNLPDDLLGKVLSRIVSPRDRARFATVCGAWRAAASRKPAPPVAPLLLLSSCGHSKTEHLCSPDDSWVFHSPSTAANKRLVGSHDGGWVALLDTDNCVLAIVNLFSGDEVALSAEQSNIASVWPHLQPEGVSKVIFSGNPASSDGCILAAIVDGWLWITLCRVGCHDGRWTANCWDQGLIDIAFCNGDLYGRTRPSQELYKFEIGMEGDCTLVVTASQRLSIQRPNELTWNDGTKGGYMSYIFELQGKTSMAIRTRWLPHLGPFFKVFELADMDADEVYKHKWVEVTSFGGHALFIGPTRSKAVHVPVSAEHHGLERNHVYYTKYTCSWLSNLPEDALYSVASDDGHIKMYSKKDQHFGDSVERTGYYVEGCNYATWVHPPDL
jgi:hypothetical protein